MSPDELFDPIMQSVAGRLVIQDEGGLIVYIDVYRVGQRDKVARLELSREVLSLYALRFLEASLRNVPAT